MLVVMQTPYYPGGEFAHKTACSFYEKTWDRICEVCDSNREDVWSWFTRRQMVYEMWKRLCVHLSSSENIRSQAMIQRYVVSFLRSLNHILDMFLATCFVKMKLSEPKVKHFLS